MNSYFCQVPLSEIDENFMCDLARYYTQCLSIACIMRTKSWILR